MSAETTPQCQQSQREDGGHAWNFDGDDPYIVCAYCDQMQDAHSGRVIRKGRPSQEMADREAETRARIEELREQLGPVEEDPREAAQRMRAEYHEPAPGIAVVGRQNGKTAKAIAAAVESARPVHYRDAAASLRSLGYEAAAVALERAADDEEAGDGA